MNRFKIHHTIASLLCVATWGLSLCIVGNAHAQMPNPRPMPATAQLGAMQVTMPPNMLINGQPERLSPGARIRAANNMLVLSGAITGQLYVVKFVREPGGMVHDVWILNETEVALVPPADLSALSALQAPPVTTSP